MCDMTTEGCGWTRIVLDAYTIDLTIHFRYRQSLCFAPTFGVSRNDQTEFSQVMIKKPRVIMLKFMPMTSLKTAMECPLWIYFNLVVTRGTLK